MGTLIGRTLPRPARPSRWLVGAALGALMLVAAACSSGGASTPTSTTSVKSPTASTSHPANTTKPSSGYGY
jgi:hypothetical protein